MTRCPRHNLNLAAMTACLVWLAFASVLPAQSPGKYQIDEKPLGRMYDGISDLALSADGRHMAYVSRAFLWSECILVHDGRPSGAYDGVVGASIKFSPDGERLAYVALPQMPKSPGGAEPVGARAYSYVVCCDDREGPKYESICIGTPVFSPNSQSFAYAARQNSRWHMIVNGKPGTPAQVGAAYDSISIGARPFSPDSRRLAYIAGKGGKSMVIVDGRAEQPYDAIIEPGPQFSPDSKRISYIAKNGDKMLVVVDGEAGPEFDEVADFAFTADSRQAVYAVKKGAKFGVMTENLAGPEYDQIGMRSLALSPAGGRVAYAARRGDKWCINVDGKEIGQHAGIAFGSLVFSPDAAHFAYIVSEGRQMQAVIDGRPGQMFDHIGDHGVIFSPDSRFSAYAAKKGDKWRLVMGDKVGAEYDEIVTRPFFSGDSMHLAYGVKKAGKIMVVHDGLPGPQFDAIDGDLVFSPDGKRLAYVAIMETRDTKLIDNRVVTVVTRKYAVMVDGQPSAFYDRVNLQPQPFSADSRHFAFAAFSAVNGTQGVWRIIQNGQAGKPYTGVNRNSPVFCPDGTLEYLAVEKGTLYRVRNLRP